MPSQIHRHRVEQRREVLLRLPDLHTGSRHHRRQLRKFVQNRIVNILSVSRWCSVGLPERCFDGVAAHHMDGDSAAHSFPNNAANRLGNRGTSGASAGTTYPRNEQCMGREFVKELDEVRDHQGLDSDRRFLVSKGPDPAVAKVAVLEVSPSNSPTAGVNREGSTEAFWGYDCVCQEYFSLGSNDSWLLSEARTRSSWAALYDIRG